MFTILYEINFITGDSFHSLAFSFRVGERTMSSLVIEICEAIFQTMKSDYLKVYHMSIYIDLSSIVDSSIIKALAATR